MILPVFQEVIDQVRGSGRLRQLGLLDSPHPWRAGEILEVAIMEPPPRPPARGDELVQYRTLTFRMKEITVDPGVVSMTRERWAALALEAGRLADLAFIREFRELDDPGVQIDPRLRYVLDRVQFQGPRFAAHWADAARRFHEDPSARTFSYPSVSPPPDLIEPLATTAAQNMGTLTLDMIRQARDLLMGMTAVAPRPRSGPQTVAEMERYLQESLLGAAGTPYGGRGRARQRFPTTEDRQAPAHAEPLAPLPDWLAKVNDLIEEVKT